MHREFGVPNIGKFLRPVNLGLDLYILFIRANRRKKHKKTTLYLIKHVNKVKNNLLNVLKENY